MNSKKLDKTFLKICKSLGVKPDDKHDYEELVQVIKVFLNMSFEDLRKIYTDSLNIPTKYRLIARYIMYKDSSLKIGEKLLDGIFAEIESKSNVQPILPAEFDILKNNKDEGSNKKSNQN